MAGSWDTPVRFWLPWKVGQFAYCGAADFARGAELTVGRSDVALANGAGAAVSTVSIISVAAIAGRTVRVARHIGNCVLFVLDTWRLLDDSPGRDRRGSGHYQDA